MVIRIPNKKLILNFPFLIWSEWLYVTKCSPDLAVIQRYSSNALDNFDTDIVDPNGQQLHNPVHRFIDVNSMTKNYMW